ncbi:hypothetical protein FQN50_006229 [Emmonsiellopsis sp. PD_5]|nr:hypothetical protein FQN50_006229 [Emmonsiellopsis sp. PD_5]
MAEVPRRRRKAVDGLDKLPTTEQEWLKMVTKLHDLCSYGRFSASTAPKEAFLTVRCIWPQVVGTKETLPYILRTRSFFNEGHVTQAAKLWDEKLLGLEKLNTLFDVICSEAKTPRKWLCTVADGLGPFSTLVSLKRQILDKVLHTTLKDEPQPMAHAPRKKRHYDASQPSSGQMSDSPMPRRRKRLPLGFDVMDEDYQPAPDQPSSPSETELAEK